MPWFAHPSSRSPPPLRSSGWLRPSPRPAGGDIEPTFAPTDGTSEPTGSTCVATAPICDRIFAICVAICDMADAATWVGTSRTSGTTGAISAATAGTCGVIAATSTGTGAATRRSLPPDSALERSPLLGRDRRGVRAAVFDLAARQRRENFLDQTARRFRAQLDGDALAAALGLVEEVDAERMVEGRVEGVIVVDVGGVDPHPAVRPLGAAHELRLLDDVRAHDLLLRADQPARLRIRPRAPRPPSPDASGRRQRPCSSRRVPAPADRRAAPR